MWCKSRRTWPPSQRHERHTAARRRSYHSRRRRYSSERHTAARRRSHRRRRRRHSSERHRFAGRARKQNLRCRPFRWRQWRGRAIAVHRGMPHVTGTRPLRGLLSHARRNTPLVERRRPAAPPHLAAIARARGHRVAGTGDPVMKQIRFYLDFVSPYAWLAFERLPDVLAGLSHSVAYQPVLLGALLQQHHNPGPAGIAPKREWTYRHVGWLGHAQGTPLQLPARHPFNPLPLLRLALACSDDGHINRFVAGAVLRHV